VSRDKISRLEQGCDGWLAERSEAQATMERGGRCGDDDEVSSAAVDEDAGAGTRALLCSG